MEREHSLLCLPEPTIGLHSEPGELNPHAKTPFLSHSI